MFRINDTVNYNRKEYIIIDELYDEGETYFTLRCIASGEIVEGITTVALMRADIKDMISNLEWLVEERDPKYRHDDGDIRLRQFMSVMFNRYCKVYDRN
jgi:hypothetical protein